MEWMRLIALFVGLIWGGSGVVARAQTPAPTVGLPIHAYKPGDTARVAGASAVLGPTRWDVQTDAIRFFQNGRQIRGDDRTGRATKADPIALPAGSPLLVLYRSRTDQELGDLRLPIPHYSRLDALLGVPARHVVADRTLCVRVLDGPHRDLVGFVLAEKVEKTAKPPLQDVARETQKNPAPAREGGPLPLMVGEKFHLTGNVSLFMAPLNRPIKDFNAVVRHHVVIRPDPAGDEIGGGNELVAILEMSDGSILDLSEDIVRLTDKVDSENNVFRVVEGDGRLCRIVNESALLELWNLHAFPLQNPAGTVAGPHVLGPEHIRKVSDAGK